MVSKLRKLAIKYTPKQLKEVDDALVSTHPILWSTQLHFILFYCVVMSISYGGISTLFPVSGNTAVYLWIAELVFGIIAIATILIWFYFLMKYDFRKAHGKRSIGIDLSFCLVCFFGFFLIIASWVGPTLLSTNRVVEHSEGMNYYQIEAAFYQPHIELNEWIHGFEPNWCFIISVGIAFYLLIIQSAINLFGLKRLVISIAILIGSFYFVSFALIAIGEIFKSILGHVSDVTWATLFFTVFSFLCVLAIWLLQKTKIYRNRYFTLWLFVTIAVPMLITSMAMILLNYLEMDDADLIESMLIALFSLLFIAFLPWQRSVVYKLYSLPK